VISDELSKYGLLLKNDFLDTVELNVKLGAITISPVSKDENVSVETYQISIDNESDISSVDLSYIQNDKHVQKLQTLIDNYKSLIDNYKHTRDVGEIIANE